MTGIYIHVPFCRSKCPYCDFYSVRSSPDAVEAYIQTVTEHIRQQGRERRTEVDTIYFGGGTPSVIGGEKIVKILSAVRESFDFKGGEITVECNPSTTDIVFYETLFRGGVNRISLGMQSAADKERRSLGRTADKALVEKNIIWARQAGIDNISLDVMLGVPHQSPESLEESIAFIGKHMPSHLSAYMLKLEKGTYFYENSQKLALPDEDTVCDMYILFSQRMRELGYEHYEISNFALDGKRSAHNMKYWKDEEYLGFGPGAHSFFMGERFSYEPDLEKYITDREKVSQGKGGDSEEYLMLALRLSDGFSFREYRERFGCEISDGFMKKAELFASRGLARMNDEGISLTPEGFLLSNSIIGELSDYI